MENKHTPGPWRVTPGPADGYGEIVRGATVGYAIAECNRENRHDARLIAAAPELLAALENVRNVLAGLASGDLKAITADSPALAQVRAAIAKATQP